MILEFGSKDRNAVEAWQRFIGAKVDGDFGLKTVELTKAFQKANNLEADGRVGPATLAAAERKGFVNPSAIETCLPTDLIGIKSYNREKNGTDQYAKARTIEFIKKLGEEWNKLHPNCPLQAGDMSRRGGGDFPPHASHKSGEDVDFRPIRKDSAMEAVTIHDKAYDAVRTEEFVKLVRKLFTNVTIFFNDSRLISKTLTRHAAGHDNHLHVRFN